MRSIPEPDAKSGLGPSIILQWLGHQILDDPEALHAAEHALFEVINLDQAQKLFHFPGLTD